MNHTVRIHKNEYIDAVDVPKGTNLLDFLRDRINGLDTPCGGNGSCGKCRVKVDGIGTEPSLEEKALLGGEALRKGFRLACYNSIDADLDIYAGGADVPANIVTEGRKRHITLNPVVKKEYMAFDVPSLHDQTADLERIMSGSGKSEADNNIGMLGEIPGILRASNFKVTLVKMGDTLVAVEPGDTSEKLYGVAFDIGTTTIAAYLYDLHTGKRIDVYSIFNPQRKFGADVLSRIEYTMASASALAEMNDVILSCLNMILKHFASKNGFDTADIYTAVCVGNTTMMHFLMKADAGNIAVSPFIPVTTSMHSFKAHQIGLHINRYGYAVIMPCVSGYIGADTVAAVLSSGMYEDEGISLLIDIGTNGEIVLGNREWLYACSAAAGPAFEGANIHNGVGGVAGAIDKVRLVPAFEITTIGGEKPIGICGSGIVDAIAEMLSAGLIDETGRITDGSGAFVLVESGESATGIDIAITQKDIRELQNAKAAIAAGIQTLVKRAGIHFEDIGKVYLAGGFGSLINIDSALKIGLLPGELRGRIESIGNAAGSGAVEGLLSEEMLHVSERIKAAIHYVELSASADFTDAYVECMMFE